ncbi:cobalamin biosynthesis protein CobG [Streptomyces sp. WAC06614]|uniref:cobalamin biosynthesis protein CobG n=1 Tax=Streptomyces sp. WAC06614 TaxID=2487416 RepID=UPI0021AF7577|nr:cobalamin biosynthesis protein CobG [Streptomyces sp. WAC06614]
MPPPPSSAPDDAPGDARVVRDRGDACPGALRLHAADDGHLARIRVPGGLLDVRQAAVLGLAAERFGDGHLELTSRGNVQLRGLDDDCGARLAELLGPAGLIPAPGHERVRNIVASPLSGLSGLPGSATPGGTDASGGAGHADVTPWVGELDRLLCASPWATALSGRFLFALDDGRGDVAALDPDVTVLARPEDRALVLLGSAADAVEVPAADAVPAALHAARSFLDAAAAVGTRAWRVAELPAAHAPDAAELAERLRTAGIPAARVPEVRRPYAPPPRPWGAGSRSIEHLYVLVPLGRLGVAQWQVLTQVAGRGAGTLRLTPWRGVVLPRASARRPVNGADRIRAAGLVLDPGSPWEGVTACTGRPGCAKSLADVRADAAAVADASPGPLPVHWSGCERRCGHPRGTAWVDVLATGGGYELSVHGRPVPPGPDLATSLATARNHAPAER